MKLVLATGIYPPDIGGPATYVHEIAREFSSAGHKVIVITYGGETTKHAWKVVGVPKAGGAIARWKRYAKALRACGSDADAIFVFTSVSAGIPLIMSKLKKSKRILRLGGDFFWERHTDAGGRKSLREWYASRLGFWRALNSALMEAILRAFDVIVYSTEFQRDIHARVFRNLPSTVIRNAHPQGTLLQHQAHAPFRLLFMGRYVRFKNLPALIEAIAKLEDTELTIVGEGPTEQELRLQVSTLGVGGRINFQPPAFGDAKERLFREHDLLVLPSVTEISPNIALEAVSTGLPVLLSEQTGLKDISGIVTTSLRTSDEIASAVQACRTDYPRVTQHPSRPYATVSTELLTLL